MDSINVYSVDTVDIVGMVNIVYNISIAITDMYDVYCRQTLSGYLLYFSVKSSLQS